MDKANWLLGAAKSKLQDAYQQHVQPLTQPLAQQQPLQHRRASAQGTGPQAGQGQAIQASSVQSVDARVAKFKHELLSETIDLKEVKRMAFHGIPDKDGLRAITWKVRAARMPGPGSCRCSCSRWRSPCNCQEPRLRPPPAAAAAAGLPSAGHVVLGAEAGGQPQAVRALLRGGACWHAAGVDCFTARSCCTTAQRHSGPCTGPRRPCQQAHLAAPHACSSTPSTPFPQLPTLASPPNTNPHRS
jgi:hypothetical protein